MKFTNIHIIGIPEGEEREKEVENVFDEIMAENFPNLKKETETEVQEVQKVPNKMNSKKPTSRHIITKMAKDKGRILKAAREKESHT